MRTIQRVNSECSFKHCVRTYCKHSHLAVLISVLRQLIMMRNFMINCCLYFISGRVFHTVLISSSLNLRSFTAAVSPTSACLRLSMGFTLVTPNNDVPERRGYMIIELPTVNVDFHQALRNAVILLPVIECFFSSKPFRQPGPERLSTFTSLR